MAIDPITGRYTSPFDPGVAGLPRFEPRPYANPPGTMLGRAIGRGVDAMQQNLGSVVEGVGNVTGIETLSEYGADVAARNAAEIQRSAALEGDQGLTGYLASTVGENAPQIGASVGIPLAGRVLGGVLGAAGGPAGSAFGQAVGTALGTGASFLLNYGLLAGENRERQKDVDRAAGRPVDVDEAAAFGAAVPGAAMETLSGLIGAKLATTALKGGTATKFLSGATAVNAAKAAGRGALAEVPTEVGQQALTRAQAGQALADSEAAREYFDAGLGAAILGGTIGAGSSIGGDYAATRQKPAQAVSDTELMGAVDRILAPTPQLASPMVPVAPPEAQITQEPPAERPFQNATDAQLLTDLAATEQRLATRAQANNGAIIATDETQDDARNLRLLRAELDLRERAAAAPEGTTPFAKQDTQSIVKAVAALDEQAKAAPLSPEDAALRQVLQREIEARRAPDADARQGFLFDEMSPEFQAAQAQADAQVKTTKATAKKLGLSTSSKFYKTLQARNEEELLDAVLDAVPDDEKGTLANIAYELGVDRDFDAEIAAAREKITELGSTATRDEASAKKFLGLQATIKDLSQRKAAYEAAVARKRMRDAGEGGQSVMALRGGQDRQMPSPRGEPVTLTPAQQAAPQLEGQGSLDLGLPEQEQLPLFAMRQPTQQAPEAGQPVTITPVQDAPPQIPGQDELRLSPPPENPLMAATQQPAVGEVGQRLRDAAVSAQRNMQFEAALAQQTEQRAAPAERARAAIEAEPVKVTGRRQVGASLVLDVSQGAPIVITRRADGAYDADGKFAARRPADAVAVALERRNAELGIVPPRATPSARAGSLTTSPEFGGLTMQERIRTIERAILRVTRSWKGRVTTNVVATIDDLPPDVLATFSEEERVVAAQGYRGFIMPDGQAYLIASNLRSVADAIGTFYHEVLGHFGLRVAFQAARRQLLQDFYDRNQSVRDAVEQWKQVIGQEAYDSVYAGMDISGQVEEALATISESGPLQTTLFRRLKSLIQKFARKLGWDYGFSDDALYGIIAEAHRRAMDTGGDPAVAGEAAKWASQRAAEIAPQDPDYQTWASGPNGEKVIADASGKPVVYYTGTSKDQDFTKFKVGRHGGWFTTNPDEASEYAMQNDSMGYKRDGWSYTATNTASRVIPVFLRAANPYRGSLPTFALAENYKKAQSDWFDSLRRQGYDAWMPADQPNLMVALKDSQQIKSVFARGSDGKGDMRRYSALTATGGNPAAAGGAAKPAPYRGNAATPSAVQSAANTYADPIRSAPMLQAAAAATRGVAPTPQGTQTVMERLMKVAGIGAKHLGGMQAQDVKEGLREKALYFQSLSHLVNQYGSMFPMLARDGRKTNAMKEIERANALRTSIRETMGRMSNRSLEAFDRLAPRAQDDTLELMGATFSQLDPMKRLDDHKHLTPAQRQSLRAEHERLVQAKNRLARSGDLKAYEDMRALMETIYYEQMAVDLYDVVRSNEDVRQNIPAAKTSPILEFASKYKEQADPNLARTYWETYLDKLVAEVQALIDKQGRTVMDAREAARITSIQNGLRSQLKTIAINRNAMKQYPYFHLGRFGKFFATFRLATVRQADGKLVADPRAVEAAAEALHNLGYDNVVVKESPEGAVVFIRTEARADADRIAAMALELQTQGFVAQGSAPKSGEVDPLQELSQSDKSTVEAIIAEVRAANAPQAGEDEATQAARQRYVDRAVADIQAAYLARLPDASVAKVLARRKGRAGFDKNMMRSFAQRMQIAGNSSATRLAAEIKGDAVKEMTSQTLQSRTANPNKWAMSAVLREVMQRESDRADLQPTTFVDTMRAFNHNWFLAMNPGYWLTQITQLQTNLWPELVKSGVSYKRAFVAMAQSFPTAFSVVKAVIAHAKEQGFLKYGADATITSDILSRIVLTKDPAQDAQLKDFILRIALRGSIDIGSASRELGRAAEGRDETRANMAMRWASSGSFYLEMMTRLTAALAAREIAVEKKMSPDATVDYAADVVQEAMFNYTEANRARAFSKQGIAGQFTPLATAFLTFQFQMLEKYSREIGTAFMSAAATPAERSAARRWLLSHLTSMTMLAGTMGLPFVTVAARVVETIVEAFSDDEEPYDVQVALRNFYADVFGKDVAEVLARGLPRALGFDISERIGAADILPFSRLIADRRNWDEALQDLAFRTYGAPFSMVSDIISGGQKIADGHILDGMKDVLPVALKNPLEAVKIGTKGITDSRGNLIPVEAGTMDIIWQTLGLRPAARAEYSEASFAQSVRRSVTTREATEIRRKIISAVQSGDAQGLRAALREAQAFDRASPAFAILPGISGAIRQSQRRLSTAEAIGAPVGVSPRDLEGRQMTRFANY